jgi:thiol-disulfide isomerase/thioredoxin
MTAAALATPIGYPRWREAQAAERSYWYPDDPAEHDRRRAAERAQLTWYAAMLGLDTLDRTTASVLELGAGPQGLVSAPWCPPVRATAVEPLALSGEDADRYRVRGVPLVQCPAEEYRGEAADEVWMTNVLQHVLDPRAVLRVARQHARHRVRIFEWLHVPESVVHPHVITPELLWDAFGDWAVARHVTGRCTTPTWSQEFVAVVYERGGAV